jgi:hypothetical protein
MGKKQQTLLDRLDKRARRRWIEDHPQEALKEQTRELLERNERDRDRSS